MSKQTRDKIKEEISAVKYELAFSNQDRSYLSLYVRYIVGNSLHELCRDLRKCDIIAKGVLAYFWKGSGSNLFESTPSSLWKVIKYDAHYDIEEFYRQYYGFIYNEYKTKQLSYPLSQRGNEESFIKEHIEIEKKCINESRAFFYDEFLIGKENMLLANKLIDYVSDYINWVSTKINQPFDDFEIKWILQNGGKFNLFNRMPIFDVKQYFSKLSSHKSKNGKPFLSDQQVTDFIERAFLGNSNIQKLEINFERSELYGIYKLFHSYYLECAFEYEETSKCMGKYIRLLSENFTSFEFQKVKNNFSNSTSHSKEWK